MPRLWNDRDGRQADRPLKLKPEKGSNMKVTKKTAEYTIYQKRNNRYAVKGANSTWLNGEDKVKVLLAEGLIKLTEPAPKEEEPAAEEAEAEEAEEASAEEATEDAGEDSAEDAAEETKED